MNTGFENGESGEIEIHPEAAHMANLIVDEIEDDHGAQGVYTAEEAEDMASQIEAAPDRMSREAFCALWETSFNLPAMMLPDLKPLAITSEKKPASDEAADAAYDLIEMHFPNLLLSTNDTFASIARMLPFMILQAGAVRAILIERRRAKIEALRPVNKQAEPQFKTRREAEPEAANKNAAPGPVDWMDAEEAA